MQVTNQAIELIKHFEGFRAYQYLCSAGVKTIGFGHTGKYANGEYILTRAEATRILLEDVKKFELGVSTLLVGHTVKQARFDGLVCFAFNVGLANLAKSTLLKKYKAGDVNGAAQEFPRWNKAGGKEMVGLTRRRLAEQKLFITGAFSN
jgi:lysozyme